MVSDTLDDLLVCFLIVRGVSRVARDDALTVLLMSEVGAEGVGMRRCDYW